MCFKRRLDEIYDDYSDTLNSIKHRLRNNLTQAKNNSLFEKWIEIEKELNKL